VYSYLAQGAMTGSGLDVYRSGPALLGGPLAANVPTIWQHTPAPYGPVFLDLAAAVTNTTGSAIRPGIIGMRALALIGVGLLAWSVPRLGRSCGVDPSVALWLGVLNPLVLLHLVADAHNEALMLGLMSFGLVLAIRRWHVLAIGAITLAALVKAPAGLALAFIVPIWAPRLSERGRWVRAMLATLGVAIAIAVGVTAASGSGFGWASALATPTRARTWMSITTDLGWAYGTVLGTVNGQSTDATRHMFWLAGLVIAGLLTIIFWCRSQQLGPVVALGLSLSAVVLAGPVVHPWYLLWGIVPLATAATSPVIRRIVAVGSVALVLLVMPGGVQPGVAALIGAALGTGAGIIVAAAFIQVDGRVRALAPPVAVNDL
jgi:hypothetical protein